MEEISRRLKEKRLELGLTVEDISAKTRLTQKHIMALEEGNLAFFHDDLTYLRFFVKSYCEAVDIDFEDVKEELRKSIDDYTQTISMTTQMEHEEIEKNITNSDKLTRVNTTKGKVRKPRKVQSAKRSLKKIDISFVSLVAIVGVVIVVLGCGLVIFMRSTNTGGSDQPQKQPVAQKQEGNGDNEYPTSNEKESTKKKENAELAITKTDVKQYTIENVKDDEILQFELYFGGSNSGYSISVDGVVDDATAKIYSYQTTAVSKVKVKKGSKIQMYVGWMAANTLKINGKNVKIDDSIINSNMTQTLEFVVTGAE